MTLLDYIVKLQRKQETYPHVGGPTALGRGLRRQFIEINCNRDLRLSQTLNSKLKMTIVDRL